MYVQEQDDVWGKQAGLYTTENNDQGRMFSESGFYKKTIRQREKKKN